MTFSLYLSQTPGGKSYDAVWVLAWALDQMIKDGYNVDETPLGFDFSQGFQVEPWKPGDKLLEYIKKVTSSLPLSLPLPLPLPHSPLFPVMLVSHELEHLLL